MDLIKKLRSKVLTSALMTLILGILFLLFPVKISGMAVTVVGIIILVYGILDVLQYVRASRENMGGKGNLIWGIIVCLIGIFFITNVGGLLQFTTRIISFIILIFGLNSLDHSVQLRRENVSGSLFNLSISIAIVVAGVALFLFPLRGVSLTMRIFGAVLVMNGVLELFTLIRMGNIEQEIYETRKTFRGDYDKDIIDVEAKEKE